MPAELTFGLLVAILIGVLEAIKRTELLNHKFIPVASIVLGLPLGVFYTGFDIRMGVLMGALIGLSAVGLYSGSTNVLEGIKAKIANK